LPHNTNAQERAPHMHRISRAHARPGDLIFYMSGGSSYHVAIFAGHGMQYAAATPQDGVVYQHIWSKSVRFATDWH
jgi:cell wall-associated NlpC family hydrolase